MTNESIGTEHVNALLACFHKRIEDAQHAIVKQLVPSNQLCCIIKAFKLCNWEISNQYCSVGCWTVWCGFIDVPQSEIYGPGTFVTSKVSELCLVRG